MSFHNKLNTSILEISIFSFEKEKSLFMNANKKITDNLLEIIQYLSFNSSTVSSPTCLQSSCPLCNKGKPVLFLHYAHQLLFYFLQHSL